MRFLQCVFTILTHILRSCLEMSSLFINLNMPHYKAIRCYFNCCNQNEIMRCTFADALNGNICIQEYFELNDNEWNEVKTQFKSFLY